MSEGYFGKRTKGDIADLHSALITAHHILHHHEVLDAFGHVSVRNPDNPSKSFWLPQNCPPALLTSADDLVEYWIEDAACVEKADEEGRQHFVERYIHSEVYKRFPEVNAVVHSHCREVLPYCVGSVPLRAMTHMAGFLGTAAPVWGITAALPSSAPRDFLVRTADLGHHLSAAFNPSTSSSFIYSKMRSALPQSLAGSTPAASADAQAPAHPVVLMRNHGFTAAAAGLELAVYQAVYARDAAAVETAALRNEAAWAVVRGGVAVEGSVDLEGKGKIKGGKVGGGGLEKELAFLSEKEARDCWETMGKHVGRAWRLWCGEVEVAPLYRNTVGEA